MTAPIIKIADAFRAGRSQVAGNMAVSIGGGCVSLTLHGTTVLVQDNLRGTITFNTGGYRTVTTAKAINAALLAIGAPKVERWTWRGVPIVDGQAVDETTGQPVTAPADSLAPTLSR